MDQCLKIERTLNPQENANLLSKITFAYTFPIFYKGFQKKKLDEEDIPNVSTAHSATDLGNKLEESWKYQKLKGKPLLWLAILRVFGAEFMQLGLVLLCDHLILRILRGLSLIQLIRYFSQQNEHEISLNEAYMYGGFIVGLSVLSTFFTQVGVGTLQLLAMKVKVACSSLVYRKCTKLSKSALAKVGVGHITNLLSNDLGRLDMVFAFLHLFWICPLQIVVITGILYSLLGLTSTIGIAFMVMWVPLLVYLGKKISSLRLKTAIRTDTRVQLMNEIVSGIKVIKMHSWEKPFEELIHVARRAEVKQILSMNYIRGLMKLAIPVPKLALFISVITYILTGNTLTAVYVFAIACFYENIKFSLITNCVIGVSQVSELKVSLDRIQKLLLLEDVEHRLPLIHKKPGILLKEISAKWRKSSTQTLNGINLKIEDGELVCIVGPVGSGKSSIFQVILNELHADSGSSEVNGEISYASQEPWIFNGNIQQNILFGEAMQIERYKKVLQVCALEQDLSLLPYTDQTLVGERGVILSGGQKARVSLARAVYRNADIYLLDDPFSAVDVHVANHIFQECLANFLSKKCVVLIAHQLHFLHQVDRVYVLEHGTVFASGTFESLECYSKISKQLEDVTENCEGEQIYGEVAIAPENQNGPESSKELRKNNTVSASVYIRYIEAGDSVLLLVCVIILVLLFTVAFCGIDFFAAYWADQVETSNNNPESERWQMVNIHIYTGIAAAIVILTIVRLFAYFKYSTRISIKLHNAMFLKVMNSPMAFYHENSFGRIINRFSKDMGIIDEVLPVALMDVVQGVFNIFGAIVIICMTNMWLILATVILFVLFYLMRVFYLVTSQNLARLDGTARSPVYSHLIQTLQGLTTIRAYNAELKLQNEFDEHQDFHTTIWSLFVLTSRAFGMYIEFIGVMYIALIVFGALLMHDEQHPGSVGLAVTQSIVLVSMLQWSVIQTTEVENKMASVERVVEYTKLPGEHDKEKSEPPSLWPRKNGIKFVSLSLQYSKNQYALKSLNFTIEPCETIGIVGRTGAGKSSLISALFQLAETEGAIYIDDVDITNISKTSLRSRISIIPQDPVVFSGTVRKNLDPLGIYKDSELWLALEKVQLKSTICKLQLGLDFVISNDGANFSVGQRQMLCLARAIIKQNKILVLDEATANVDSHNDTLIQKTIKENFTNCTVLTIAHRLNTIMDSDKVLVMSNGEIVEYDHPHRLLQNKNGMFYGMLQKTGSSSAESLAQIAEMSYKTKFATLPK